MRLVCFADVRKKKFGTNEYAFHGGGGGGGIDLYPSLETKYIIKETAANALFLCRHTQLFAFRLLTAIYMQIIASNF